MTGDWDGSFSYPGGEATTPFHARIVETGGRFVGALIEPDLYHRGESVSAECIGHRSGRGVDFTKSYLDPPQGYENPVDYVGQLSADGMTIAGMWSLFEMNGTFEMHREQAIGETEEAETVSTVPASGTLF